MKGIRPAAVAGSWYPGSRSALARAVDALLDGAGLDMAASLEGVTALLAPHAGLMYSGRVAAHAYQLLRGRTVRSIILVGPSHFVGFDGVAIWSSGGFETPLGVVRIDEACAAAIKDATPVVYEHPAAHAREHSLELQLPFIQRLLPTVTIVPLVMGFQTAATARTLGDALGAILKDAATLLVASTDLSHYHDAPTAARLDDVVIECVSRFDPPALQDALDRRPEHACGGGPTVAVMRAARLLGACDAAVLKYGDSGDVSGDKSSVVGYLAAAFGKRKSQV